MKAFLLSMWMVFIAELGDKTQLVALCLASRYNARTVLSAIFCATLLVHVISVLLGGGVAKFVPASYISLAAGVAFIIFGLWTLRGDSLDDDECENIKGKSPFWLVFTTFFLAELGDKTMLTTVAMAATMPPVLVWLGSSIGMVLSDGIAIVVGQLLGKKLPEKSIKIGGGIIFLLFGLYRGYEGARIAPAFAVWIAVAISIAAVIGFFILVNRDRRLASQVDTI